jgi:hypothetical protein
METNKNKRVVSIAIDDDVRKLTIEGKNQDEEVVMREELSDDDLDAVTGGIIDFAFDCGAAGIPKCNYYVA